MLSKETRKTVEEHQKRLKEDEDYRTKHETRMEAMRDKYIPGHRSRKFVEARKQQLIEELKEIFIGRE